MDEERPLYQLLSFLRIVAVLALIIVGGIALVVSLVWYLRVQEFDEVDGIATQPVVQLPEYAPDSPAPNAPTNPLDEELAQAEADYKTAKAELESALDPEQGEPSLREDLGILEGAVMEIVAALSLSPDSDTLKRALLSTYRQEVRVLQKSIEITETENDATG